MVSRCRYVVTLIVTTTVVSCIATVSGGSHSGSSSSTSTSTRNDSSSPYATQQQPQQHHQYRSTDQNNQLRYIPSTLLDNEYGTDWVSVHPEIEFLAPSNYNNNVDGQRTSLTEDSERMKAATEQFLSYRNSNSNSNGSRKQQRQQQKQQRQLEEGGDEEEEEEQSSSSSTREDNSQYRVQPFVEGVSDYDAYQQAWRMLGFMIDCNTISAYDQGSNNQNNNQHSNDNADGTGEGCTRYVLWAAYVDLGYEGGGIGEYQFWDPSTNSWDTSTCDYMKKKNNGNSGRCAKMDCHVKNTHWSLLGFFKHKDIDEWMGQLFKHEGVCVWSSDQYNFMKNARNAWPQACTNSGTMTSDGSSYIYYDIKPKHGGGISMGLYTDTKCVKEYQSTGKYDPITLENVVGNFLVNGGDSHSNDKNENSNSVNYETLSDAIDAWDEAFSVWMQCQPCTAYDRHNYGYSVNDDSYRGSSYNTYRYGYDDDYAWNYYYSSKYGGSDFDCYDDADYTNVNQCMKFMAKTTMNTATFRDLAVATAQGTLVDQPLAGYYAARTSFGMSTLGTYLFLVASILFFVYGILKFRAARRLKSKDSSSSSSNWNPKEPLVFA